MKVRNHQEMLDLILGTAKEDPNIRAVLLEGSRANPNASKDPFQDYDVIYTTTKLEPYVSNLAWIERFGERMILQMPDLMGESPPDHKFTYLMQFMDGNRIDLNLFAAEHLGPDKLSSECALLLDKDGAFAGIEPPSEKEYFPQKPSTKEFFDCCNEFWWVAPYVAKGLWRNDIRYAKYFFEHVLRVETMKMLTWHFGIRTDFKENPGKQGKAFRKRIEADLCDLLVRTYADADIARNWAALDCMCMLFRRSGAFVAAHFGYEYPREDDTRVSAHLLHVRHLPGDAKSIY